MANNNPPIYASEQHANIATIKEKHNNQSMSPIRVLSPKRIVDLSTESGFSPMRVTEISSAIGGSTTGGFSPIRGGGFSPVKSQKFSPKRSPFLKSEVIINRPDVVMEQQQEQVVVDQPYGSNVISNGGFVGNKQNLAYSEPVDVANVANVSNAAILANMANMPFTIPSGPKSIPLQVYLIVYDLDVLIYNDEPLPTFVSSMKTDLVPEFERLEKSLEMTKSKEKMAAIKKTWASKIKPAQKMYTGAYILKFGFQAVDKKDPRWLKFIPTVMYNLDKTRMNMLGEVMISETPPFSIKDPLHPLKDKQDIKQELYHKQINSIMKVPTNGDFVKLWNKSGDYNVVEKQLINDKGVPYTSKWIEPLSDLIRINVADTTNVFVAYIKEPSEEIKESIEPLIPVLKESDYAEFFNTKF